MPYDRTNEGSTNRGRAKVLFRFLNDPSQRLLALFLTSAMVVLCSSGLIGEYFRPSSFQAGEISNRTIRAPRDFFVEDSFSTEKQKADAERAERRVFEFDDTDKSSIRKEISAFLQALDSFSSEPGEKGGFADLEPQERSQIERAFAFSFTDAEWTVVTNRALWPLLEQTVADLIFPVLHRGIILDKAPLESVMERSGAALYNKDTRSESALLSDSFVYSLDEAEQVFESLVPPLGFKKGPEFDAVVIKLGKSLLKPNIKFDREKTEERIQKARDEIAPSYFQIKRGETIVRVGDRISKSQVNTLLRLREHQNAKNVIRGIFGYFVLSFAVLFVLYSFCTRYLPGFKPSIRELWVISMTLIGSILLERVGDVVGTALSFNYPEIEASSFSLIAPLAAGGVLLQTILGPAQVIFFVLSFSLLTGVVVEEFWLKLLLITIGNLVGTLAIQKVSRRSAFLSASLRIALMNVLVTLCYVILFPEHGLTSAAAAVLSSAVGGLLSGILAAGLLPIAEYIGGYVTAMKLLELASLDRPLLRELSLQAPGTWNHSIVMGQLGEFAAEAIGANPVITRVGAYYHDIGKAKKPLYFVENQTGKDNRHDRLTPSMSALIIRSHVKDGIEMARAAKLPQSLIDFIAEHHGTALIEYFHDKALKEAEAGEVIDENLFRYPGPKPQTKESGILMLADQVEAVSRTIADPTPAKIQGMVQKIINRVFASGQLDESELTLKDLHLIAKSFTRVLTGIVHRRIEYPEQQLERAVRAEKAQKEGSDESKQSAGEVPVTTEKNGHKRHDSHSEKESGSEAETPLKRLGL